MDNTNPTIRGGVAVADVSGTVGAAIVDEQQLPIGIGLRHDAVDAPLEPLLGIIYRYYYAEFWGQSHGLALNEDIYREEGKKEYKARLKAQKDEMSKKLLDDEHVALLTEYQKEDFAAYKEWEDRVMGRVKVKK